MVLDSCVRVGRKLVLSSSSRLPYFPFWRRSFSSLQLWSWKDLLFVRRFSSPRYSTAISTNIADDTFNNDNSKSATQKVITGNSPSCASSELKDVSILDDDNSLTTFVTSFAETVQKDVKSIISKIDGNSQRNLAKRWKVIFQKEKDRYQKKDRDFVPKKLTIEDLWLHALSSGFDVNTLSLDGLSRSNFGKYESSCDETMHGNHMFKLSQKSHHSPIFQLPMNEQSSVSFKDFQTVDIPSSGKSELQSLFTNYTKKTNNTKELNDRSVRNDVEMYENAIFQSLALLTVLKNDDWRQFDSGNMNDNITIPSHTERKLVINKTKDDIREFLRLVTAQKFNLTTSIVNLLLAHIIVSSEIDTNMIGHGCLQIFEEMKILADSGLQCRPDSITFRLLILAFTRRLQGVGESIKLVEEIISDPSLTIDDITVLIALQACNVQKDFSIATVLMETMLKNNSSSINVDSCILYNDMLQIRNLKQEAIDFFNRINQTNVLSNKDIDRYISSLCQVRKRNRRGADIDVSSYWKNIFLILKTESMTQRIDHRVWMTFVSELHYSAKDNPSLWSLITDATKIILDSCALLGEKHATIGLQASFLTEDSELASVIIQRVADESISRNNCCTPVSLKAMKNALKTCLVTSDAKSARSIRSSFNQMKDLFSISSPFEIARLVLLCHCKVGDAEHVQRDLRLMADQDMNPGEELYSSVLHSLAGMGRYQEMEELFQSMLTNEANDIKLGALSFDAILLARKNLRSWDSIISIFDEMKQRGITPSSRTIECVLVAYDEKGGGESSVFLALDYFLQCNAQFDESAFLSASKILYKEVDSNLEGFRQSIRDIGEQNPNLRFASINLMRSLRDAEMESRKSRNNRKSQYENEIRQQKAWRIAVLYLMEFLKELKEHKHDIS